MRKSVIRALGSALVLSSAFLAATAASATSYDLKPVGLDPKVGGFAGDVKFSYNNGYYATSQTDNGIDVGRLTLTGTVSGTSTKVSFDTYCIDLLDHLAAGTFSDATASAVGLSALQVTQLTALLANAQVNSAVTSAAAQLGVWDIVYDGSGKFGTSNGFFTETLLSSWNGVNMADVTKQANLWLGNVNSGAWTAGGAQLHVLQAPRDNQSQIYVTGAVPEPASWAMMIAGFGMIGGAMRARRRNVAFA